MGIWQFASGPIADLAVLALAMANPAMPDVPSNADANADPVIASSAPRPDEAEALNSAKSATARFVDFTLSASAPGMTLRRAGDGLFYCDAWVNGVSVRFLVDTGATTVVLTPVDAARVGVMPGQAEFRYSAQTAGGLTAMARVRLAQLSAGRAERRDVDAAIAAAGLGVSLLGQSYLSQFASMRITGDTMVLE